MNIKLFKNGEDIGNRFESNVISYEYQTYDIKEIDKNIKIYGLDNIVTINKETELIHILGGKNEFNRKTNWIIKKI